MSEKQPTQEELLKEKEELSKQLRNDSETVESLLNKKNNEENVDLPLKQNINEDLDEKVEINYMAGDVVEMSAENNEINKTQVDNENQNKIQDVKKSIFGIFRKKEKNEVSVYSEEENQKFYDDIREKINNGATPEEVNLLVLQRAGQRRRLEIETGPLSGRIKSGIAKGLDKWDEWGKEKGARGYAKRFTKMAVSMTLIGAITSLTGSGLGMTSALSGGATSYIGRKLAMGLGIGGLMELSNGISPEKKKKIQTVMRYVMIAGSAAFALSGGGLVAGVAVAGSAAFGYGISKLINKLSGKIIESQKREGHEISSYRVSHIDFEKFEEHLKGIEDDAMKALKVLENDKLTMRVLSGTAAIMGSMITLTGSEITHNIHQFNHPDTENITQTPDTQNKIDNNNLSVNDENIANQNEEQKPLQNETTSNSKHANVEVAVENGHGAISTIKDLQEKLGKEYSSDLQNNPDEVPESIKHIINTDADKLAQEYGMYKPGEEAESVLISKGSSFEVNSVGDVTYHDGASDKDFLLEKGPEAEASNIYEGKMIDTDNTISSAQEAPITSSTNEFINPVSLHPDTVGIENQDININTEAPKITEMPSLENKTQFEIDNPQVAPEGATVENENIIEDNTNINTALSPEAIERVNQTYEQNIKHIFPDDKIAEWNDVKNKITVEKFIETENAGGVHEIFKPLVSYINKLQEITGLKPLSEIAILGQPAESLNHFINRALEKAQEMNLLDKVKL